MPNICTGCKSTDIEVHPVSRQSECTNCGLVLSDHGIVNEIQFLDNGAGQSSAAGNFYSHEGTTNFMSSYKIGIFHRESREVTISKTKKRIESLATQLDLPQRVSDIALNFYKLCLKNGKTRGQKSSHLIGACVYLACRLEQIPYMSIDVSDMLEIDVYDLGRAFMKLKFNLCINDPNTTIMNCNIVVPSIYIERFAHKLQFGDQTQQVIRTATRLVQRMMKDSIHTGRRPSGVAGAALILAARYHNFNRTIQDVIPVIKLHESTLRKRLMEFGSTASSEMTPDEFMNSEIDDAEDPPSYKAARRKEEEDRIKEMLEKNKDFKNQFSKYQQEINKILKETRRKRKLKGLESISSFHSDYCELERNDTVQFIAEETMKSIQDYITVNNCNKSDEGSDLPEIFPSTASMGITESIEESLAIRTDEPPPEVSTQLDLEGIDDEEIDSYILSDKERELKTKYWMQLNKEYLEEMEKKKERERQEEEQRIKDGNPPKKRTCKKKVKSNLPARTAGEAMENLIREKKLSSKIDYSVLASLNGESERLSETRSTTSKASSSSRLSKLKIKFLFFIKQL